MALRFTVLGSGSAGNASLLRLDSFGLLLDIGLGPRQLAARLSRVGASWDRIHAVVLTHTHTDHWNDRTFAHLLRRQIPVYCHAEHCRSLRPYSTAFVALQAAKLVRLYQADRECVLTSGLRCRPLVLRHDGGPTFGFRLEGMGDLFSQSWALAYVADLGCWDTQLAQALTDVDLLALEFNHDVDMELASGRPQGLVTRILGDDGHLSNDQAAALLREVVRGSTPGRLQHLVQLHLSRDCNRPALAARAARAVFKELRVTGTQVHTACQDKPTRSYRLGVALSAEPPV